jgi:hypothetical protein
MQMAALMRVNKIIMHKIGEYHNSVVVSIDSFLVTTKLPVGTMRVTVMGDWSVMSWGTMIFNGGCWCMNGLM